MPRNTIGFSSRTFGATKNIHANKDILTSIESSPALRKEISRVFQQANRRIQNIENKGMVSPAVIALNKGDIKGFTKFSMKGDWESLKMEYAKAVSFLQQPTSTATGTKEYQAHLKKTYGLTDDEFSLMQSKLMGKIASISDEEFLEQYLMQYKDFTGELETEARDVSSQIETEAVSLANAMQSDIDSQAAAIYDETERLRGIMGETLEKIMNGLAKFGL